MQTRLTLRPGQPGTRKLLRRFGERLVHVRYLYDDERGVRLKTVELIVEEVPWNRKPRRPRRDDRDCVGVRVECHERELRAAVKQAGAIWRPGQRLWEMQWKAVRTLRLQSRVVDEDGKSSPDRSI